MTLNGRVLRSVNLFGKSKLAQRFAGSAPHSLNALETPARIPNRHFLETHKVPPHFFVEGSEPEFLQ